MRLITVFLAATLCGCAGSYRPQLSAQPSDPARYEADLDACRKHPLDVVPDCRGSAAQGMIFAPFGAVGALGNIATQDHDVCNMRHSELVDRCLERKGYRVL